MLRDMLIPTIGIPSETKPLEGRIALTPGAVAELIQQGLCVWVQSGAGRLSGYEDVAYQQAGAKLAADAAELYQRAQLIVKVKEPIAGDLQHLRAHHILFCYLHLAAEPTLNQQLQQIGLTALAFETLSEGGQLPLLAPMSAIAGRLAVQMGCQLLMRQAGGKGLLLGGVPGAELGQVVVIGAGMAGWHAAQTAYQLGAQVTVFDKSAAALRRAAGLGQQLKTLFAEPQAISSALSQADLVIGAVLTPGAKADWVVTRQMLKSMTPRSVLVDISIDQGGCFETSRPTNLLEPTYIEEDMIHLCVTNLPGSVPRTSTQVLSGHLLPYVLQLVRSDYRQHPVRSDYRQHPVLRSAINIDHGKVVHPALL
jgi:alanine dehydrogenase